MRRSVPDWIHGGCQTWSLPESAVLDRTFGRLSRSRKEKQLERFRLGGTTTGVACCVETEESGL